MSVRLLIVDDSPLIRSVLRAVLAESPRSSVVGEAGDGLQAEAMVKQLAPDVVTMDMVMPMMSGLETIERIMAERPTPIIVVADVHGDAQKHAMEALDRGAVALFPKPTGGFDAKNRDELARAITRAAQIKVRAPARARAAAAPAYRDRARATDRVRRHRRVHRQPADAARDPRRAAEVVRVWHRDRPAHDARFHAGAGVVARREHAARRPARARWAAARAGQIAVAPDDAHLEIGPGGTIRIRRDPPVDGHRPSGTVLLRSLAQTYGTRATGVVLSGMGRDGADGARRTRPGRSHGVRRDPDSAIVGGMPREALKAAPSAWSSQREQLGHTLARLGRTGDV